MKSVQLKLLPGDTMFAVRMEHEHVQCSACDGTGRIFVEKKNQEFRCPECYGSKFKNKSYYAPLPGTVSAVIVRPFGVFCRTNDGVDVPEDMACSLERTQAKCDELNRGCGYAAPSSDEVIA